MAPKLSCPVYKKTTACPLQLSESSVPISVSASIASRPVLSRLPLTGGVGNIGSIGSIPPPGSAAAAQNAIHGGHSTLTLANLTRINNANAQECHQGKASLHHTLKKGTPHQSESVADASYYSSVLASFGSAAGNPGSGPPGGGATAAAQPANPSGSHSAVGPGALIGGSTDAPTGGSSGNWQQSQYYR